MLPKSLNTFTSHVTLQQKLGEPERMEHGWRRHDTKGSIFQKKKEEDEDQDQDEDEDEDEEEEEGEERKKKQEAEEGGGRERKEKMNE